jgi:hypothetical protein
MATPKEFGSQEKVSRGPRKFFAAGIAMVNHSYPHAARPWTHQSAGLTPRQSPLCLDSRRIAA